MLCHFPHSYTFRRIIPLFQRKQGKKSRGVGQQRVQTSMQALAHQVLRALRNSTYITRT